MEKLCKIRDIQRSVMAFEQRFLECYGLSLNEGMALCSICQSSDRRLTSGEISEALGLTSSNTSKVIASIEKKELVVRALGQTDKRQMYFTLTPAGEKLLATIKCIDIEIPELLKTVL